MSIATAAEIIRPCSSLIQAIAAGLSLDPQAVAAGRKDGAAKRPFRPTSFDMLSYASGFRDGELFGE